MKAQATTAVGFPAYSHDRMKQSVRMCEQRAAFVQMNQNTVNALQKVYCSDEVYIRDNLFGSELFVFGLDIVIIAVPLVVLLVLFYWRANHWIYAPLSLLISIGIAAAFRRINSMHIINSSKFKEYCREREDMCRNRPKIEAFQRDLKMRIEKMEKQMRNRDICIIPEPYWDCASELMYYIDNSRADNLKEAINLHHIILHEMEISRTMDSMYRVALDTQRAAERACYEAEQGRIASEQAASAARSAEWWSFLNYIS